MKECSRFKEHLLLDVHQEPLPEHDKWREHLATCPECRQEKEKLRAMLLKVEEGWRVPQPTSFESARLKRSILQELEKRPSRIRNWAWPVRLPVPALAGAVMIMVAGWLGWQHFSPHRIESNNPESEERLLVQEKDLLEDMELLEDMDVIQKLVQILDKKEAVL